MAEQHSGRFLALDGWRGACAVLVAIHNFGTQSIPWHFYKASFFSHSSLFVDFFFVLSGFVITHAYIDKLHSFSALSAFMLRRFGRLWPLHVTIFAAFLFRGFLQLAARGLLHLPLTDSALQDPHSIETIITNILLIQAFDPHSQLSWNTPSWSISTEFWTYLIFASVCIFWPKRPPVALMAGIALLAAGLVILLSPNYLETNTHYAVFRCIYGFFIGHLVYRAWGTRASPWSLCAPLEIFAVLAVIAFVTITREDLLSMAAPFVFGFVVLLFAYESGPVSTILKMCPFINLGRWSYSIYMVHWFILSLISRIDKLIPAVMAKQSVKVLNGTRTPWVHSLLELVLSRDPWMMDFVLAGYVIIVVAISALTYRFVEQPGRKYFNRIASDLREPSVTRA
jgi:peptidoglycan/LPS O-acetylase OafA/YrhL